MVQEGLELERKRRYRLLWLMLAVLVVSVIGAMLAINRAPAEVFTEPGGSTERGYTYSLVLFFLPVAILAVWFARHRETIDRHWRAAKWTLAIIFVLWSVLDMLLANVLFQFPDKEVATLGVNLPGWHPDEGWGFNVPIEEFLFYFSGSAFIVLMYIWGSEVWFRHHTATDQDYLEHAHRLHLRTLFNAPVFAAGLAILLAGIVYKNFVEHEAGDGFPLYLLFLVLIVSVPSALFFRKVIQFVNLRSFLFTAQALVMIALMWEVTLALPYGWWNYNHEWMTGIFIVPWSNLPVEAAFLWFAAAWSNIAIYEILKLRFHTEKTTREVFFHRPADA